MTITRRGRRHPLRPPDALRPLALAACLALASTPAPGQDRGDADRQEGALQPFINADAEDLPTRLEVLRHSLDRANQRMVFLTFLELHGDRIRAEQVLYPNRDGDLTPGYVFGPKSGDPDRVRPGLVLVHGGYHSSLDVEFFPHIARAVEEGYEVIFPEYRGSRGYGAGHYEAQSYGGKDVDDVLAAADYLATRPGVDGDRLGIVGISRGGMLALLAIAREPSRFVAAVDIVGLADFVAYMSYKPDYRRHDVAKSPRFGGLPFDNLAAYMDASPLNHVDRIETPLLILATTHDRTVPVRLHSQRLIDALKARGKPFEAKIFEQAPGGHAFFHGESPEAHDARRRVSAFLDRHLNP